MSNSKMDKYFFRASAINFMTIPGAPLAYWVNEKTFNIFNDNECLTNFAEAKVGLQTGDNDLFLRQWHEVPLNNIGFYVTEREETENTHLTWFPCNKGGEFRKWYGNHFFIVNWSNDGHAIRNFRDKSGALRSRPQNIDFYFQEAISWSDITSSNNAFRYYPAGFINDATGHSAFGQDTQWKFKLLAFCNTKFVNRMVKILNPTMHFHVGYFNKLPYARKHWSNYVSSLSETLINISKADWDSYEISWNFTTLPLLQSSYRQTTLAATYQSLRAHWQENTLEMQRLEEENNRIFIEAYGLEDELTPDVPLEEITLTCNPHYRYHLGKAWDDKSEEERTTELETRLQQDTVQEFISYAVGCMFGRYSLDKEGLVLANQGETLEDYLAQVPNPSFMPDEDNVIPMLDGDWFTDDVVERFKEFLKITFGEEHYETNLAFIEKALNVKGTRNYSIRDYFLKEFYNDHVRTYKKRPIYWLFSSPKGSFNALVYMHRYRPDTVSVVLNGYLREYQTKLKSHKQNLEAISIGGGSQTEKTRALKEIERINKVLHELEEYEREVVYPLATEQVSIDLDDGVKQNYPKLGKALKKITGL